MFGGRWQIGLRATCADSRPTGLGYTPPAMGRAGRILSGLFGFARSRGPVRQRAARCVLLVALCLAARRSASCCSRRRCSPPRARTACSPGSGWRRCLAVLAGLALGALVRLEASTRRRPERRAAAGSRTLRRALFEPDPRRQRARVGGAARRAAAARAVLRGRLRRLTRALILGMAQPHFAAVAIVAAHLAAAAARPLRCSRGAGSGRAGSRARSRACPLGCAVRQRGACCSRVLLGARRWRSRRRCSSTYWEHVRAICRGARSDRRGGALLGRAAVVELARAAAAGRGSWPGCVGRALLLVAALRRAVHARRARRGQPARGARHARAARSASVAALRVRLRSRRQPGAVRRRRLRARSTAAIGPLHDRRAQQRPRRGLRRRRPRRQAARRSRCAATRRCPRRSRSEPPIVLITIDTFAAERMRALGYKRTVTPRLDAFADALAAVPLLRSARGRRRGCRSRRSSRRAGTARSSRSWSAAIRTRSPTSELMLAEVLARRGLRHAARSIPDEYFTAQPLGQPDRRLPPGDRLADRERPTPHNSAAVTDAALAVLKQGAQEAAVPVGALLRRALAARAAERRSAVRQAAAPTSTTPSCALVDREVGRLLDAHRGKLRRRRRW